MGDFALEWNDGAADLVKEGDDLKADDGLRTAVFLSLFTDRRAEDDDSLPSEDGARRGWWGDEFAEVEGDRIGSRLWLLDRSKREEDVVVLAEEYAKEGLQWMIDDSVAEKVDVTVTAEGDRLILLVEIYRPGEKDPTEFRFDHAWDGEANAV